MSAPSPSHLPLLGLRVVELAGIGPGPYCGMLLADLGADVIRVARPADLERPSRYAPMHTVLNRGRRSIAVDLKHEQGAAVVLDLAAASEVVFEGFRPGVAERLGVGPSDCLARNPRLVYGRMTGWGQDGPLAGAVGHDINYLAVSGALSVLGRAGEPPTPPANLLGDFGGGGLMLAFGIVSAVLRARETGTGCVIDAAIVDGAASMLAMHAGMVAAGQWSDARGSNLLDTGAPYYDTYRCEGGEYVAVGALEPAFYASLLRGLGLDADPVAALDREDPRCWPQLRARFAEAFAAGGREHWVQVFAGTDACVSPVLRPREAAVHPDLATRRVWQQVSGTLEPAPAPRFGDPGAAALAAELPPQRPPYVANGATREVLTELGYSAERIDGLFSAGAVA
jgi:alpha-methylacyl-CoA racemase